MMVYIRCKKFVVNEDANDLLAGTYTTGLGPGWTRTLDAEGNNLLGPRDGFNHWGYCWPGWRGHVESCEEVEAPVAWPPYMVRSYPAGVLVTRISDEADEDGVHSSSHYG